MEEVYFIIPVYNEGEVVAGVVNDVLKVCPHVICVNDGSTDNSYKELMKTKAYIINHPINMGQGAALQTGIEFARSRKNAKYFVTYDADGQHRLADVQKMVKILKKGEYDIVLGSRFLGSAVNMPRIKRVILKLAVIFSNLTSGLKLTDTHNGLRAFNKHAADSIQITMSDMAHASEFLDIIRTNKLRYIEVPVQIEYTDYSMSKGQSITNAVNIVFDMMLRKLSK